MTKTYRIDNLSHFNAFKVALFALLILAGLLALLFYDETYDDDLAIKVVVTLGILFVMPSIYLHFCYYFKNRTFSVEASSGQLIVYDSKSKFTENLTCENVKVIDIYASASFVKMGTSGALPHQGYHYAVIKTEERDIVLTSLLYPDVMYLSYKFMSVKINYHETFFADL